MTEFFIIIAVAIVITVIITVIVIAVVEWQFARSEDLRSADEWRERNK